MAKTPIQAGLHLATPRRALRTTALRAVPLIALVALCGCGGGGGDNLVVTSPPPAAPPPGSPPPPPPPPPPPEYTLTGNVVVNTEGTEELSNARTTGSLTKGGSGRLNLLEYSRFDAGTFVNAGSVHVIGNLRSNVTVQPGAELVGYAVFFGNIHNAGTFTTAATVTCSPWDYWCSVAIRGNYTQTPDAKLRVQLGSGTDWKVTVDGTATLSGGTLEFFVEPNSGYIGTAPYRENILFTELGLSGTFDRWTSPGLFLEGQLVYFPGSVVFDVTRVPVAVAMQAQGVGDPVLLGTAGRIDGAFNAADPLARTPRGPLPLAQQQFFSSAAAIQRIRAVDQAISMLDSLSGESHSLTTDLLLAEAGPSPLLQARLDALQHGHAPGAWSGNTRQEGGLHGAFAAGSQYNAASLLVGHDARVGPRWLLGTAVGQTLGHLQFDRGGGRAQIQTTPLELALLREAGAAYAAATASHRRSRIATDRPLDVADGQAHRAYSRREARTTHLRLETGRTWASEQGRWVPFAALGHDRIQVDAFAEWGDTGFELAVADAAQWRTYADVGVRYLRHWPGRTGSGWLLDISGQRRSVLDASHRSLQAAFTGMPEAPFALGDGALGRDQTLLTLRLLGQGGRGWWWYADYRDARGGLLPARSGQVGIVVPF